MKKVPEKELDELEAIIKRINIDPDDDLRKAVAELSHREGVSPEIMSLATDTMLVAEHDYLGEFQSKEKLLGAVLELREDNKLKT